MSKRQRKISQYFSSPAVKKNGNCEISSVSLTGAGSQEDEVSILGEFNSNKRQKHRAVQYSVNVSISHDEQKRFRNHFLEDKSSEVKNNFKSSKNNARLEKNTPLESQVVDLRAMHPGIMLMVEVGYKYRFFGEDADAASKILGIYSHYDHNFLTASIPAFRLNFHVRRLVEAGHKVGVVRQTETAALKAQGSNKLGPFLRRLSGLYTKSTIEAGPPLDGEAGDLVDDKSNKFLMCVVEEAITKVSKEFKLVSSASEVEEVEIAVVMIDPSTGEVKMSHFRDSVLRTKLESHLLATCPVEIILAVPISHLTEKLLLQFAARTKARLEKLEGDLFRHGGALEEVIDCNTQKDNPTSRSLESLVDSKLESLLSLAPLCQRSLAVTHSFLRQFELQSLLLAGIDFTTLDQAGARESNPAAVLLPNAIQQLEILSNSSDGSAKGTLLSHMDRTLTPAGSRLLRKWITNPLKDADLINGRLEAVSVIRGSVSPHSGKERKGKLSDQGKKTLTGVLQRLGARGDFERGITRIMNCASTPQQFVSILRVMREAFLDVQTVAETDSGFKEGLLGSLVSRLAPADLVQGVNELLTAVSEEDAIEGRWGSVIVTQGGDFPEVERLRASLRQAESDLDDLLVEIRKAVRIPTLTYVTVAVKHHLIQVPKSQRVPSDWLKVNSTVDFHRYHPPKVLSALDRLAEAQEELEQVSRGAWKELLQSLSVQRAPLFSGIKQAVKALACLDCLHSLAALSLASGYVRPSVVPCTDSQKPFISIVDGRHPVLEAVLHSEFVPNSCHLSGSDGPSCQLITGPNMGGKSVYIRQVALIVIMAQAGSFVPASSASLSPVDMIFCRMGAWDSLIGGKSTFLGEVEEAAQVLLHSTERSLVIMDEFGRGTSTHDGMALAHATLRYILQEKRSLTLFVSHFLKLADLQRDFQGLLSTYHVSYLTGDKSDQDINAASAGMDGRKSPDVTFLYRLVPGVAGASFGLNVARLARVPEIIISRASQMASDFEQSLKEGIPLVKNSLDSPVSEKLNEKLFSAVLRELKDALSNSDCMAGFHGLLSASSKAISMV